jgi:hypothetical protein
VQSFPRDGAQLEAQIFLSARGPDQPDARFDLPWLNARETRVSLVPMENRAMAAAIECDGPARLHTAGPREAGVYLRPGAERSFSVPSRYEAIAPTLVLPPETTRCQLTWGDGNSLRLVRENIADPVAARLDARSATCRPYTGGDDALAKAFFAERALSQTCAGETGAFALYPDELEALRVRLEYLTGSKISRAALQQGDAEMVLDFSRAPRFEQIVVSYLHIRADITGYLVIRTLAFHAARGTKVRIAVSGSMTLPAEKRLLEALASQYPNVQVQYFQYNPAGFAPGKRLVGTVGNSHHVKIFAGLSAEPGLSFALVGGRKLNDMFYLPDLDAAPTPPHSHDYTPERLTLDPRLFWTEYEDFEIGLFSRDRVADVIAHFGLFWNRDARASVMAAGAAQATSAGTTRADGLVRHYISLPWADGQSQEDLFVDVIDAARIEVIAMSPFLYPTPRIDAALVRAAERGVRVRLVTRVRTTENSALGVDEFNFDYFQRRRAIFGMYAYAPPDRVTHVKLLVVDDRLGIVTSTNLNRRSFVRDTENGLVFLDRDVARALRGEIERAMRSSERDPKLPVSPWIGEAIRNFPGLLDLF